MKRYLILFFCLLLIAMAFTLTVFAKENTELLSDIFTYKGYSTKEAGNSLCIGFDINTDAIEEYKKSYNDDLTYGVVFSPYDMLGGKAPLDENGQPIKLDSGKVLTADLTSYSYAFYDLIISDIPENAKDTRLVISAYIIDGDNIYYVQSNGLSNTVEGISFNEAINGRIYVDELGFKYLEKNKELTVIGYDKEITSSIVNGIYVPYSYNGMKVTAIGENAFSEFGAKFAKTQYVNMSSGFVTIYLPTTVTEVGSYAFDGCICIKVAVYNEDFTDADYKAWDKGVIWGEGNGQARDTIWKFRPAIGWSRYSLVEIPDDYE